ncbi:MAG: dimethylargininase [Gammaproteobacteria bacterium]|jgi:dimethylargininase|nr:dimethylargininase [Gammaproteobacteria bacterium]MDH3749884.1 dimethylargininase [Gammaproteobacteria bacterium]
MALTAITREVNTAIGSSELTFLPRVKIDTDVALQQHQHYQSVLSSLGCEIVVVPTEPGLADSVFIEDTAIVLDEIAVLCRPGAESRQPEVAGVKEVLQKYRTIASIQPPGTLDGGDVLRIGKAVYAGLSTRSNQSGIEQLRGIVADYGYSVHAVETAKCLHLKSAVSEVAPGMLLINSDWISRSAFGDCELIDIDTKEAHAANALLVGRNVIYPSSFPRTMDKLVKRGINVTPVGLSELQKAEGAATCCSLIFTTQ